MGKLTKNQKLAAEKIEAGKAYSLKEAASLVNSLIRRAGALAVCELSLIHI